MSGFNPYKMTIKTSATPPISSSGHMTIWASNADSNVYIIDDKGLNRSLNGERITKKVVKNDHGFVVGQVIRYDGSEYFLAKADSSDNSEAIGIIESIIDKDTFVYVHSGNILLPNYIFIPGTVYFISPDIAGNMTNVEPETNGQVSKPIFLALTLNSGIVYTMRGDLVTVIDLVNTTESQSISGDKTFFDDLSAMGGFKSATKVVTSVIPYTVGEQDNNFYCNTTNGDISISLPFSPFNGREVLFKKITNDVNKIIIDGNTHLIDNVATLNITGYLQYKKLQYVGSLNNWFIIG